ncbi:radical SAM protein [Streptomyces cyaneofuscatus]|uniref:Radical SAM protein n=1 Tax=Streptomyces cyaneofuscatus TaxID=66883 RepID=A0ABZ1EY56_9ACTN|nr:radical SAM protein [Streptomyces cyaneofuscatus]WSB09068.1 radical SAM protein [Streptomyces cyaneofuscatus]WSD47398.1 radical SAM protein [Streptomyces cyaneofuscatus]
MHQLIASPYNGTFLIARPGSKGGMRIPRTLYEELAATAESSNPLPAWLLAQARTAWGLDLADAVMRDTVLVRSGTGLGYGRATYEINKGCNFNCEHCYLAERKFEGLPWPDKARLLYLLRDAGVLWLQFTGGEPLIDRDFVGAYTLAHRSGMLIEILTNGSRLHRPEIISLLRDLPPHKVTVSLYGATPDSFDSLTRKPGAFKLVEKGLVAAREAGLALELALIITRHNAHELDAMRALAERYGASRQEYGTISPTYSGTPEPLAAQAPGFLDKASVFKGCPAGHTFFHVDPHGLATMCKVGRENPIDLMTEGLDGLLRLPGIADAQMLRTGGCGGCQLSGTCRVCRPLAKAYQEAKAPLNTYCQHGSEEAS